jgi:NhaP-type Na+/H+ or K+/H+ antiporter
MTLSKEILIVIFLMLFVITGNHFVRKAGSRYIQESGFTTLTGLLAGYVLYVLDSEYYLTNLSNHFQKLFLIILLPPIIFEAGYNMRSKLI